MRGFAYPNVDVDVKKTMIFIGCGRYRAAHGAMEEDESLAQLPKMANPARTFTAALSLAPELRDNHTLIYERQDCPDELYQGDSMVLAYLLTSVHRVRRVRQPFEALPGHIWCTGAHDPKASSPTLSDVDHDGFVVKLRAFRAASNPDRVFFVPFANLALIEAHGYQDPFTPPEPLAQVRLLDLPAWRDLLRRPLPVLALFSPKVVVGIHAHELPLLIEILFHSPPDPEIAQWLHSLKNLRKQDQITEERYWEVLEHIVGSRSIAEEELMDALATHRERLYLTSTTTVEQLSKIPLRDARTTRVHQVLVAIYYALPVVQTVLGLRFVLIPPGTVHDLVMTTPYYLAETPISHADWARILGNSLESALSASRAAVDITPLEIERFVSRANAQVGATLRLRVPSERQWRFTVEAAGPLEPPPRETLAGAILKTTLPSALGLYDMLGLVYQLCQQGRGKYAWYGGSYRTPASDFSPIPVPVPVTTAAFAKNPQGGFRPALAGLEEQP